MTATAMMAVETDDNRQPAWRSVAGQVDRAHVGQSA
jgi:hypothetical protein